MEGESQHLRQVSGRPSGSRSAMDAEARAATAIAAQEARGAATLARAAADAAKREAEAKTYPATPA